MSSSRILASLAGKLTPPTPLTANKTLLASDSGTHFFFNSAATATLTFPDTLPVGFNVRISNAGPGQVLFNIGTRLSYGNGSRDALIFQWDVCDVVLSTDNGNPIFLQTYNLALPVLYAENTAAVTRSTTTLTAMPGMSLPLEANAAYDVDVVVPYTSSVTTESLKLGVNVPTGAVPSLQIDIFVTNTSGTSNRTGHFWPTAALAASGTSGSASVVGQTLMAHIWGKVRTGATAGALSVTAGARDTSGTVSVAANAASMSVSKVYDQGRT